MSKWHVGFDDGTSCTVDAVDVQDAIRQAHQFAGGAYTYQNIVVVRKVR